MKAHAEISISRLGAIVQCPAYVRMNRPHDDAPRTPEQTEGDAWHWAAEQAVVSGTIPAVGSMTPQGIALTEEHVDGVILWVDTCGLYGVTELPVFAKRIHPEHCWGTPDWRRFDSIEGIIRLKDFKGGFRYVEAFENWQAVGYFAGILDELEVNGFKEQGILCEFEIVQPRSYCPEGTVRKWGPFPATDLRSLILVAETAAELSLDPNAPARVGPACFDCNARHECKTLMAATSNLMASLVVAGDARLPLEGPAIGVELGMLQDAEKLIEARRAGLEAQTETMLRAGQRVPGYGLSPVEGKLNWREDAKPADVITTAMLLGVNVAKPPALVTPTQAKAAGMDAAILKMYSERKSSMRLTRDNPITARKAFGANGT